MAGVIIKVKGDHCPENLDVFQNFIWVKNVQCCREKGHKGFHRSIDGAVWSEQKAIQSIIENEGRSL